MCRGRSRIRPMIFVCVLTCLHCADASAWQASASTDASIADGRAAVARVGCGSCHMIAELPHADGQVGPPLTGIASRAIIAGTVPNTPENLLRWIENPQAIQPGVAMPPLANVDERTARDIVAYLETLH